VKRSLVRLSLPLREPFATANGVVSARELLLLRIEDDDGAVGFGEGAPFEPYDGVTIEAVADALSNGAAGDGPPQARTAEEMARLDLEARRQGRPIGEPGAERIAVNRTLPAGPPDEVAARAREGVRDGFACFKVKVGLPDDLERVGAVRETVGPWPALRIDANGAWSVDEAVEAIQLLAPFDLQLVEQPCRTLDEMAEVRRAVGVPIAADESVATAEDVRAAAEAGACDTVNVKLAASGGFTAAREALRAAGENGLGAFLSSTLDGPWGIAAALQLAASEKLSLACGLATLELFEGSLARALPPPVQGLMAVPQGPGLGVWVDDVAIAEVLVEELA
jgi:o-succinylbenzoate synthase